MSTSLSKLNAEQKEQCEHFANTFITLPFEYRVIVLHLMKNLSELFPYIKQLDKTDEDAYCDNVRRIVLCHKAGIEIEVQGVAL